MDKDRKIRLEWIPEAYRSTVASERNGNVNETIYPLVKHSPCVVKRLKRINTFVNRVGNK